MSVFTTVLSASDGVQVTGSVDIKGQGLITAGIISGSAIAITGSAHLGHPAGQSALVFSRIDSDVQADEQLGSIQFDGRDSNSAGVGAEIRGEAADTWASNDRRATDIKFFTQDNTSGVNTLTGARLTVSSSGGVGADIHIHTPVLQVGTGGDGNQGKTGSGVQARVSACTTGDEGDAGIEIEAGGTTNTSALTFARDNNTSERQGWYVDWNAADADRVTYRQSDATDLGASPIAITDPAENTDGSGGWTVRVGGGGAWTAQNAAWDRKPSLLVTSSYFSRQSLITIRNMNQSNPSTGLAGHKDAVPGIAWNYLQKNGAQNNGIWTMGIEPYNKSLTIGSPSGGLSTGYNRNTTAMVFGEAGDNTKVGIGGDSVTWGPGTGGNTRSLIPSATLHVGNQNNNPYSSMDKTLTQTSTLLLDNSINGSGEVQATLTFDVSTQSDIEYHSAHIACVNDGAAAGHTSYLSTGLYDGSGNKDSTRSRIRVDSQGGIIVLSGTMPGAGTGWPRNGNSFYDISAGDVPSGSLSLISLMDGTYGKSQPTLNFVSWTGTNGNQGAIADGAELGRITWWSSDSGNSTDNDRTAAFIQAVATLAHGGSNESPAELQFFTRWSGDSEPQKQMVISQGGNLLLGQGYMQLGGNQIRDAGDNIVIKMDGSGNLNKGLTISPAGAGTHVSLNMGNRGATNDTIIKLGNAGRVGQLGVDYSDTSFKIGLDTGYDDFGATAITIDSSLKTTLSGTLQVGGNIIKASDGGNTITMDTSDNVTIAGDLTVGGNDIKDSGSNTFIGSDGTGNINDLGIITVPTTTFRSATTSFHPEIHLESTDATTGDAAEIHFSRYDDAVLQAGDKLGEIYFNGTETNDNTYFQAAVIEGQVGTGTWTDSSSQPGRLSFYTVANGATSQTERMTIDSDGSVEITGDLFVNDYARIDALRVGTTSTDPGDGNLYVEGEVQTAQISYTDGDDAITIADGGYTSYAVGNTNAGGILVSDNASAGDNEWCKFAQATPTSKCAEGTFIVNLGGAMTSTYVKSSTYIIFAKVADNSATNMILTAEPLSRGLDGPTSADQPWDPTTDLACTWTNNTAELWIKTTTTNVGCWVTALSGPTVTEERITSWTIPIGGDQEGWLASIDDLGTITYGTWAEKIFSKVTAPTFAGVGDITLDAVGDIILAADGDQIVMTDGSTTRLTFNVDSTPEIDFFGAARIDCDSTLELECQGSMLLDINSNGHFRVSLTSATSYGFEVHDDGHFYAQSLSSNGGTNYARYDTGTGEISYWTSTEKVKENIRDLPLDYAPLLAMQPRIFDFKAAQGGNKNVVGFIAEEIATAHPGSAALGPDWDYDEDGYVKLIDAVREEDGEPTKAKVLLSENKVPIAWDDAATTAYLVKIIQDLHARIQDLENS